MAYSGFQHRYLYVVLVLLLFCFLFIPCLSRTITYDEAYTFIEYAGSPIRALFLYTMPNNHLLHSFLVWLSTSLMGDNIIAIRLPAFAAGLLSLAYIYRIGHKLGSPGTGLAAAVLLMSSPFFLSYAPTARGYIFCIVLSLTLFDQVFFGPEALAGGKQYRLLGTAMLLVLTLPTMILLIIPLILWLVLQHLLAIERRDLATYLLPMIVGSIAAALFYSYNVVYGEMGSFFGRFGYGSFSQMVADFAHRQASGVIGPVLMVGIAAGTLSSWRQCRRLVTALFLIIAGAVVFALIQDLLTGRVLFPRNYIYITPFLILLAALGLSNLLVRLPGRDLVMWVVLGAVVVVAARDLSSRMQPGGTDALQIAIEKHTQEHDLLILDCCRDYPVYYMNRESGLFNHSPETSRYILIPASYQSAKGMMRGLPEPTKCEQEGWETIDVYICKAKR